MYSVLSAVLGLMAALTVINAHQSKAYFIPLTAIAIVMAILYYQGDSESKIVSG
jgi:1,4-dihydroxy-2-naphthoate octaprenyltransferase